MSEPRDLVESMDLGAELPPGADERFVGYGVMGLPFASERHLPATSRAEAD